MEEWKGLVYKGINLSNRFEVSKSGKIRNFKTKKVYKVFINNRGYEQICVSVGSRKDKLIIKPHMAVAQNFIDTENIDLEVNHIDGNKLNNNVINLEWVTHKENMEHASRYGLTCKGSEHPKTKLTAEDTRYIRLVYKQKDKIYGAKPLSKKFGVDISTISRVARNVKR